MIDTDVHKIEPSFEMLFPLVPTRDFDEDHKVSLTDFAILANHWQTIITEPNDPQKQLDFNSNNIIDSNDLAYFSQFWLAKTRGLINDSNEMDPNQ
ncbi:MAG: dockerin type I domain-containing protein [Desulfobacterales bacterium]|nr:dockerin type I domain-containing protein [Desulfobacterales bacterium]